MRKILCLCAAFAPLTLAIAQNNEDEDEVIIADPSAHQIVVTARRSSQLKSYVPAAVEVITSYDLDKHAGVHPAEILNTTPGVHIHRGSGLEHLTSIRSPVLTGGAGAGSFLYLQDGVPLRAAGFANVNGLFEAHTEFSDGIDVFRGPGNVIHGSNALHGLINVLSPDAWGIHRYRFMVGEDGYFSGSFHLSDNEKDLSARFSVIHDNGFRDDSGYDQQKLSVVFEDRLGDWSAIGRVHLNHLDQETAGFIRGDDAYLDNDIRFSNPNPEAYRNSFSLRGQLELEKGDIKLIPYARWTDMEFLRHFVPGQATEKVGHWSIGSLNSYHGDDFIVGFDTEFTQGYLDEFQDRPSVFSFVQGAHYDYQVDAVTLAAYGEKDFDFGDNTTLSVGARAEYVDYSYDNLIDTADVGRFRRVDDRSDDFFVITPKLSITHQLSNGASLYGRAVRGARAPQVTDLYSLQTQQQPGEIKSETLDSVEMGLRFNVSTEIALEGAFYAMEKDNFFFRNSAGLNVVNGKTSHQGFEASIRGSYKEWLAFRGNINFADHTYNFSDPASSPSNTIVDGAKVDTAPEIYGTGVIRISPVYDGFVELEWQHLGEYFLDPGNTQTYPGHDVFTLRGQYEIDDGHVLFARLDNLFDKRYANRADFAFGLERYFPGRPRTLFVGLRGEF